MQLPLESRMLLAVASKLAPAELRADWRREWDAEIWWWMGSHTGERLQLAAHCSGALCDAVYLRATESNVPATLRRIAASPATCVAALAILLLAVAASSGLTETRRALHGEPFAGARLTVLSQSLPFMGAHFGVPAAKLADWNARAQSLDGVAPYFWDKGIAWAGPQFFTLLGTRAALGDLTASAGDLPSAVLTWQLWQRKFHGDPRTLGRTIVAGGATVRVIGVLPRDFWFLDSRPDLWILNPSNAKLTSAIARLKPGVKPSDAQAELRTLAWQVKPTSSGTAVSVEPIENLSSRPLTTLGLPWLVLVCATAALSLLCFRRTPRYAAFLAAKAVLSLTLALLVTVEYGASWMTINSGDTNLAAGMASLWIFLAGPAAALIWCWRDQRQRCRTCLRRLTMLVTFSEGARMLLERAGTELVCPQGHGTLFTPDGADPARQWDPMDSSWRELFAGK
jgi:hypothetical protein